MDRLAWLAVAFVALIAPGSCAWCEAVIVVNKDVEVRSFDRDDLHDLFLGKRSLLEGIHQVDIVVQDNDDKQELFLKQYLGVSASQFRTYWKRMVFTGEGKALTVKSSDQEVVEYVRTHRDAVGYIDAASPHDGVRILRAPAADVNQGPGK